MKTFCFYNHKGGTGKTTLLILLAAYLRYFHGLRVKVMDAQCPEYPTVLFRGQDLKNAQEEGTYLSNFLKKREEQAPFPIEMVGRPVNEYTEDDIRRLAWKVNEEIRRNEYDYLLLDFPGGGWSQKTPIACLAKNHLLSGIYVPFSTEFQESADAYRLACNFQRMGQPYRLLWYRLQDEYLKHKAAELDECERKLSEQGIEFSKNRIRAFNKATQTSDVRCFVRNTLCWPDRYVKMVCPELIDLFEEIIQFLQNA